MSAVSARRLNDWELESSEGSFTHTSSGLCLLLVRGLGFSPFVFVCMVSLLASLGFLIAQWLGFTGDRFNREKERETVREREREIEREREATI